MFSLVPAITEARFCKSAREFLDRIAAPQVVVPGNHDIPLYNVAARFGWPLAGYRAYITPDLRPTFQDDELAVRYADRHAMDHFLVAIGFAHVNDIDVQTFGWSVTGSSAGRATFSDVTVTKYVDPASPLSPLPKEPQRTAVQP